MCAVTSQGPCQLKVLPGTADVAPGMADLAHKGIEVKPIKPEKSTVLVAKAPAVGTVSLVPASAVPGSEPAMRQQA